MNYELRDRSRMLAAQDEGKDTLRERVGNGGKETRRRSVGNGGKDGTRVGVTRTVYR